MKSIFKLTLAASVALLMATGCSQSDGSSDSQVTPTPEPVLAGKVIDGYLIAATIFKDCDDSKTLDVAAEPNTITDANGDYILSASCPTPSNLIAYGGTSKDTGLDFNGILMAAPGSTNITPLTTLVALNPSLEASILAMLGGDSLDVDYMEAPVSQDVLQLSQQVAAILSMTANSVKVNDTASLVAMADSLFADLNASALDDSNQTAADLAVAASTYVKTVDPLASVKTTFEDSLNAIAGAITDDGTLSPAASEEIATVVVVTDTIIATKVTIPVVHLNGLLIGTSVAVLEAGTINKYKATATVDDIKTSVTADVNISDADGTDYTTTFTLSATDTVSALTASVEISNIVMTTIDKVNLVVIPDSQNLTAFIHGTDNNGNPFESVSLNENNLSLILTSSGTDFVLDMEYIYSKLPVDHPMQAFFAPGHYLLKVSVSSLPTDASAYDLDLTVE